MTAQELRAALHRLGMSVEKCAELFGESRSTVSQWLTGEASVPKTVVITVENALERRQRAKTAWRRSRAACLAGAGLFAAAILVSSGSSMAADAVQATTTEQNALRLSNARQLAAIAGIILSATGRSRAPQPRN